MTLDFYAMPGAMGAEADLSELPGDVPALVRAIQGLIVHEHFLSAYGLVPRDDRVGEVHLRPVSAVLNRIRALDLRPLTEPRPPERRFIGDCRFYALLFVEALRTKGIPARARCGFGAYFHTEKFVDHWIGEYWNAAEGCWILVDAVQTGIFRPDFDPLDVPRDRFLVAGEAWTRCRAGRADPADFGILGMSGLGFVASNLIRDVAALNKREMLPWDVWGGMSRDLPYARDLLALHDRLAILSLDPDAHFAELRQLYEEDRRLKVPPVVFNAVRQRPETVGDLFGDP
jgi:hypothetical protein